MLDKYGRRIDYLRVSVTDRCNLRCNYCMPPQGVKQLLREQVLTLEELEKLISAAVAAGVKRVRLTGGEPLVRKNLIHLISSINGLPGLEDISLTTNGILLAPIAKDLKESGLNRVNISLDTLMEHKYKEITRGGSLGRVFAGIESAMKFDLTPVKINVVVQRSFNLNEIIDFVMLTQNSPIHVRFIELMPIGYGSQLDKEFVSAEEMKQLISDRFNVVHEKVPGGGPADYYKVEGYQGTIGFINAISDHFCGDCNRLRLSADGKLRFCLQQEKFIDIKKPLRQGATKEELAHIFVEAAERKPKSYLYNGWSNSQNMNSIGG